jgi:threonine/homoserine efflux transporter RhtA
MNRAIPAPALFGISAIFHYLCPSFAVLLFPHVGVLGVAWLRIVAEPLGFVYAFANYLLFMLYIMLGHRLANAEHAGPSRHLPTLVILRQLPSLKDIVGVALVTGGIALHDEIRT